MSFVRRLFFGVFISTLSLFVFSSTAATAAPLKGLMDDEISRTDDGPVRGEFWGFSKLAKVKLVRTFLPWDGSSSTPDPGGLAIVDRFVNEAKEAGIPYVYLGWHERLGAQFGDAKSLDLEAWRKTVKATAEHFKNTTGVTIIWHAWNEPNYGSLFPRKNGPKTWLKMSNIAYDEIKAVNSDWRVLSGELAPYARNVKKAVDPGDWLKQAMCLNSKYTKSSCSAASSTLKADGISLHPYDYLRSPSSPRPDKDQFTINNLSSTRKILARVATKAKRMSSSAAKSVWLTEFGYQTQGSQKVSEAKAAKWSKLAWKIAVKNKAKSFIWFQLRDPQPPSPFNTGLMTSDGRKRPTWEVFKSW